MSNKVVARYRNEDKRIDVDIESDSDNPSSPLTDEEWLSFPSSKAWEYDYGTERLTPEALTERVRDARRDGGFAIPVGIKAQSHVMLIARHADDEDEDAYGYLIATAKGLDDIGLKRKKAIEQAMRLLEVYNDWANGYSWRFVRYSVDRCSLGYSHRQQKEAREGYIGLDYEKTGILEEAGITSGQQQKLGAGWKVIKVDQAA